jgi:putative glycosyltransferase (TIGR04372 family)
MGEIVKKKIKTKNPMIIDYATNGMRTELLDIYLAAKCDFCIYPSEYEGFGIPILEAFTHGKTVATSNVSSMPEVGGNAAIYFNPLKKEEIITCLNVLLDRVKRATYEENIAERLQYFDSGKLLNQYQKIYQTI